MLNETGLYASVKKPLEEQGYTVQTEVDDCDLVAARGGEPPVIAELKLRFALVPQSALVGTEDAGGLDAGDCQLLKPQSTQPFSLSGTAAHSLRGECVSSMHGQTKFAAAWHSLLITAVLVGIVDSSSAAEPGDLRELRSEAELGCDARCPSTRQVPAAPSPRRR